MTPQHHLTDRSKASQTLHMVNRYLTIAALSGVTLLAACATVDEQSRQGVYAARYDWIEQRTPEGALWAHCTRTARERCRATPSDPNVYQCSYREWAPHHPWPFKRARIKWEDDTWSWVEGDAPSCAVTVVDLGSGLGGESSSQ